MLARLDVDVSLVQANSKSNDEPGLYDSLVLIDLRYDKVYEGRQSESGFIYTCGLDMYLIVSLNSHSMAVSSYGRDAHLTGRNGAK